MEQNSTNKTLKTVFTFILSLVTIVAGIQYFLINEQKSQLEKQGQLLVEKDAKIEAISDQRGVFARENAALRTKLDFEEKERLNLIAEVAKLNATLEGYDVTIDAFKEGSHADELDRELEKVRTEAEIKRLEVLIEGKDERIQNLLSRIHDLEAEVVALAHQLDIKDLKIHELEGALLSQSIMFQNDLDRVYEAIQYDLEAISLKKSLFSSKKKIRSALEHAREKYLELKRKYKTPIFDARLAEINKDLKP
jgi:chromosome segregation ATPase